MLTLKQFLLPTDFSRYADHALEYAKAIAKPMDAAIHLLYVLEPIQYVTGFTNESTDVSEERVWMEAEQKLNLLQERLTAEGFRVHACTVKGFPEDEILRYAGEHGVDMIFMGTHGWRGIYRMMFGSTTEGVFRKSACPVVSVRMPEDKSL